MQSISIWPSIKESFILSFKNSNVLFRATWPALLVCIAIVPTIALYGEGSDEKILLDGVLTLLYFPLMLRIFEFFLASQKRSFIGSLYVSKRQALRLFLYSLLQGLLILPGLLLLAIGLSAEFGLPVQIPCAIVGTILTIWSIFALTFAFPAISINAPTSLKTCYRQMRGNLLKIITAILLYCLLLAIPTFIVAIVFAAATILLGIEDVAPNWYEAINQGTANMMFVGITASVCVMTSQFYAKLAQRHDEFTFSKTSDTPRTTSVESCT